MKDFKDFVQSITSEEYESMKDDIIKNRVPCSATEAIPEMSFKMCMKLLEKYHLWLND
ncbi:hypothetical protein [uncultured Robinsoniella sp.]|uniref:hypothetical protein n=1 Tax=uncultured Robinsoniella sp. TaxID=904190 RepID=UPI002913BC99|nr:hypothetical protein [Clostridiales bacterium]